jgi:hypothetical protein
MDPTYYGWKQKEKSGGTNWQIMKYKTVLKHSPQIDYVRISVHAHNTPITSGEIKNACHHVCMETILYDRKMIEIHWNYKSFKLWEDKNFTSSYAT